MTTPKVSVVIPTYNTQEEHLRQCLDSVVAQKCEFEIEVLVVDDSSTNGTQQVITEYSAKYPEIRLIEHETNLGVGAGYKTGFLAAKGDYIAVLDHDDYWVDNLKLQKQVDFLDSHPDYAICFTNGRVEFDGIEQKSFEFTGNISDYDFLLDPNYDYLEREINGNYISNLTVMYRRYEFDDSYYPSDKFGYNWFTDWYNHIWFARKGRIGYLHEVTAVHRRHESASSIDDQLDRDRYFDKVFVQFSNLYAMVLELFQSEQDLKYRRATRQMLVNWIFNNIGDDSALLAKVKEVAQAHGFSSGHERIAQLEQENQRLRTSTIFKVGRIVTWPARKLKRMLY